MHERRKIRSEKPHEAVTRFLESLRRRAGLEAIALTTDEGQFVAGSGALDLEYMGTVGASSRKAHLSWDGHTLHMRRLVVNDVSLCVTVAGEAMNDDPNLFDGLQRILASEPNA